MRLGWNFDVADGRTAGVQFSVYNLLNRTNFDPAGMGTVLDQPTFGVSSLAFHKRQAEIGVTIR